MSEIVTISLLGPIFDFEERAKHTLFGQILCFKNIYIEIEVSEPKIFQVPF
jgi:hypothetical protein